MSKKLEISTILVRQDYRNVLYFNVFSRRRWFLPLYLFLIVYAILNIFMVFSGAFEGRATMAFPAILFLLFAVMLLLILEFQLKNLLKFDRNLGTNVKRISFDEEGISVVNSKVNKGMEKKENQYKWSKLYNIFENKKYFFFFTGKRTVLIVPKRDVKKEQEEPIREYIAKFKKMKKGKKTQESFQAPKIGE